MSRFRSTNQIRRLTLGKRIALQADDAVRSAARARAAARWDLDWERARDEARLAALFRSVDIVNGVYEQSPDEIAEEIFDAFPSYEWDYTPARQAERVRRISALRVSNGLSADFVDRFDRLPPWLGWLRRAL